MKVIVDLCVVPIGVGLSVSKYIAECEKIIKECWIEINASRLRNKHRR